METIPTFGELRLRKEKIVASFKAEVITEIETTENWNPEKNNCMRQASDAYHKLDSEAVSLLALFALYHIAEDIEAYYVVELPREIAERNVEKKRYAKAMKEIAKEVAEIEKRLDPTDETPE